MFCRARLLLALLPLLLVGLTACDEDASGPDPAAARAPDHALLVYCGITMVNPVKDIAVLFEQRHGIPVTISQGGSEDLYQALDSSRVGDLYLPGSRSYRAARLSEGLLGEEVMVGFNQAALVVPEGNPRHLPADVSVLADPTLAVVIVNPDSGSIGRETKRILDAVGLFDRVLANSLFLATDSRALNQALLDGTADVILNWRATAFFDANAEHMDVLDIDPVLARPDVLGLNLLTFSAHPEDARAFMALAASPEGQAIFRRHGFIDASGHGD